LLIAFIGLVEQKIGSKFFILITSEVGLDNSVSIKAKETELERGKGKVLILACSLETRGKNDVETYTFNRITLLFSHTDGLGARW
jgi:hypothetical protein